MKLICRSGLADVGFHNFQISRETGKLVVVDTEPLFGSMLLDEVTKIPTQSTWNGQPTSQYAWNDELKEHCSNLSMVKQSLDNINLACNELPIFKKVAEIYREFFENMARK